MLQLIYVSSINPKTGGVDPAPILVTSRRNNARDQITGVLYSDGLRFMQVLEGPDEAVERAFKRISRDTRHRAIVVLSRRPVHRREFGDWQMAHRTPGEDADAFVARIGKIVARASDEVRATFQGFAEVRRAA
jgi:hypothetical protein